jgi:hypothetical protein
MPLVWTYLYTTAQSEDLDPDFQSSDFKAPMAGFGYGLPLARLVSENARRVFVYFTPPHPLFDFPFPSTPATLEAI